MEEVVTALTSHFVRRWRERRGGVPSVERVNHLIRKGQCLKRQKKFYWEVAGKVREHSTLAMFWNHQEAIIIWVDEANGKAVTLITPEQTTSEQTGNKRGNGNGANGDK